MRGTSASALSNLDLLARAITPLANPRVSPDAKGGGLELVRLRLEAEIGHASRVVLDQPGEHPADRGEVHSGTINGSGQ